MHNKIKALLLDFDNTLVNYALNEKNAIYALLRTTNITIEHMEAAYFDYREINHKYWALYEQQKVTPDEIRYKRFEELAKKYRLKEDPFILSERYLEFFMQNAVLFSGVADALQQLKNAGFRLLVLTNGFHTVQTRRLQTTGIDTLVDGILSSEIVGKAKPDPLMYKVALEQLQLQKNEVLMVGDNYASDIAGAINYGISAVHITENVTESSSNVQVFPTFTAFSDAFLT